jgi:hypothetical protein
MVFCRHGKPATASFDCEECKNSTSVSAVASNDGLDPLCPTREEIEKLAYNNLILYSAMRAKEMSKLSWTETLQLAVKFLIEQNNDLQNKLIRAAEHAGEINIV